jgi:hypothetical protein
MSNDEDSTAEESGEKEKHGGKQGAGPLKKGRIVRVRSESSESESS